MAKYIFPIYCKVKRGRMAKYPFVIAYFGGASADADADAFRTYLDGKLGNNGKAGCNKVLYAVDDADVELPAGFLPGDVFDFKVALGKTGNQDIYVQMSIPDVSEGANFDDILTSNPKLQSPGGVTLDTVIRQTATGQNISANPPNPVSTQSNP